MTTPLGVTYTFSFSATCGGNTTIDSSYGGTCPGPAILARCPRSVVPADAAITCYTRNDFHNRAEAAVETTGSCTSFPGTSGAWGQNYVHYYAVITGAPTGTYSVRVTGTDHILDPCYVTTHPCRVGVAAVNFPLAIAGCGVSCGTVPAASLQNAQGSYSSCNNQFDGFICPVTCQSGTTNLGRNLDCNNGQWNPYFACVPVRHGLRPQPFGCLTPIFDSSRTLALTLAVTPVDR